MGVTENIKQALSQKTEKDVILCCAVNGTMTYIIMDGRNLLFPITE